MAAPTLPGFLDLQLTAPINASRQTASPGSAKKTAARAVGVMKHGSAHSPRFNIARPNASVLIERKKQPFLHAHCPCRRAILILGGGWGRTTNFEKKTQRLFFSQTPEWGFHVKSDLCCKSLGEGGEAQ